MSKTVIKTNIVMGKVYKDQVTGLVGTATGIVKHQFGCIRIALQSKMKEGETTVPESIWVDEESVVDNKLIDRTHGGPTPNPKRASDPKY